MVAHTSVGLFSCTKGKMVEQWYKLIKNDKKQKEKETTAEIRIALFHIVSLAFIWSNFSGNRRSPNRQVFEDFKRTY